MPSLVLKKCNSSQEKYLKTNEMWTISDWKVNCKIFRRKNDDFFKLMFICFINIISTYCLCILTAAKNRGDI